jgi:mercuric ion transport protein
VEIADLGAVLLRRAPARPVEFVMTRTRLLATGIIGFLVSMLGCVTPVLVGLLAVLGVSGSMGWLDYVLLPAMAALAALIVCALIRRKRVQRA